MKSVLCAAVAGLTMVASGHAQAGPLPAAVHQVVSSSATADGMSIECSLHLTNSGVTGLSGIQVTHVPHPFTEVQSLPIDVAALDAGATLVVAFTLAAPADFDATALDRSVLRWCARATGGDGETLEFPLLSAPAEGGAE